MTVVCSIVWLSAMFGSGVVENTCAKLVRVPAPPGITLSDTATLAPEARSPNWQVTMPSALTQPLVDEAGRNATSGGKASINCAANAVSGPELVTMNEYVSEPPTAMGSGESCCVTARFAYCVAQITVAPLTADVCDGPSPVDRNGSVTCTVKTLASTEVSTARM